MTMDSEIDAILKKYRCIKFDISTFDLCEPYKVATTPDGEGIYVTFYEEIGYHFVMWKGYKDFKSNPPDNSNVFQAHSRYLTMDETKEWLKASLDTFIKGCSMEPMEDKTEEAAKIIMNRIEVSRL